MGDKIRKEQPGDTRIDLNDARQVDYWTKELGISQEELAKLIEKVGDTSIALRKALRK